MKTNKEILDLFGKTLIENAYDFNYRIIKKNIQPEENSSKIIYLIEEIFEGIFFDFLKIFEENEEFKLYYEENNQKINLVEISEMLKAEILNKEGWIERFSKELKKEE